MALTDPLSPSRKGQVTPDPRANDKTVLTSWDRQEAQTEAQNMENERQAQLEAEMNPKRKCLHRFFVMISIITSLTAVLMGVGQFVGLYFRDVDALQYIIRIYVLILCVMTVLNELEWSHLTRDSKLLNYWASRGAIYIFIGILGLQEIEASPANKNQSAMGRDAALEFTRVMAFLMIGVGALYMLMGIFCLQVASNRMRTDFKERLERSKETRRVAGTYGVGREDNVV